MSALQILLLKFEFLILETQRENRFSKNISISKLLALIHMNHFKKSQKYMFSEEAFDLLDEILWEYDCICDNHELKEPFIR